MHRLLLVIFLLCLIPQKSLAKRSLTLDQLDSISNQYLYEEKREIHVARIDTTRPMYYAYAYITLDVPFGEVAPLLLDIDNFENLFEDIIDVHYVQDQIWTKDSVYYIEGKTRLIHAWGLGVLKDVQYEPDSLVFIKVRPAPRLLVKQFRKEREGKIKYYIRKVDLDCMLVKLDDKRCRVGLRGISSTNKPVPLWLANIVMKIILPNLLEDLEKKVKE